MATSFSNSPRLAKGCIFTMSLADSTIKTAIAFQYNPESLNRSFQIQSAPGGQDGVHVDVFRLRGPAIETIKLDAELDIIDQLEFSNQNSTAAQLGLHPQLAQLEMLINPSVDTLNNDDKAAIEGTLEIVPVEQPLTLFSWSKNRVVPVRLTDFSITEEAFDTSLNPIRAKVSLGMRVLSIDDLGFDHPGGKIFMSYLANKEQLARQARNSFSSVPGLAGFR
jgi:hypothetical protein